MKNKYSIYGKLLLAFSLLRTKVICKRARLFRFPIDIRGREFIDFGVRLTTGRYCRLEAFSENGNKTMIIGYNVQINDSVHICSMRNVTIGNNVLVAGKVYISDNSHGCYKGTTEDSSPEVIPVKRTYHIAPVVIEDNVWIGEGVIVLPGVTIGKGAIIGANSVVNKNIEAYTIVVGQPARVIKKYNQITKQWEKKY